MKECGKKQDQINQEEIQWDNMIERVNAKQQIPFLNF